MHAFLSSLPLPPLSDEDGVGEMPVLPATPTAEELHAYNRRMNTLAARRSRQHKQRQRQMQAEMLEAEVAALRAAVPDLRAARAAFGLPSVHVTARPPRSMPPRPKATATPGDGIPWKRQQSALASWRYRRRKMKLLALEDEAAELKAEAAALTVHARL
ncbi:hypothetical protein B0H17DRAFT_1202372 [Mycena rosella]|uniref:BZIP domain-containing protein n=1 Tax=Mycena rosella TaxID=1033263 RepID=A0AAD7GIH3_MYCRO|nr:hypothetical protein B0H17DRAFT_1202372 [Mycena rosella]